MSHLGGVSLFRNLDQRQLCQCGDNQVSCMYGFHSSFRAATDNNLVLWSIIWQKLSFLFLFLKKNKRWNVLFCPQHKDIQFTVTEDWRKKKILSEKLKKENLEIFFITEINSRMVDSFSKELLTNLISQLIVAGLISLSLIITLFKLFKH